MKVKALVNCVGLGYDLKIGEIADLPNRLAEKLINFNYVEEVKVARKPKEKVAE